MVWMMTSSSLIRNAHKLKLVLSIESSIGLQGCPIVCLIERVGDDRFKRLFSCFLLLKFDRWLLVGKTKAEFCFGLPICSEATFLSLQKARNIAKCYYRTCVIVIIILAVVSNYMHETLLCGCSVSRSCYARQREKGKFEL